VADDPVVEQVFELRVQRDVAVGVRSDDVAAVGSLV
jgi:hypothetical protein